VYPTSPKHAIILSTHRTGRGTHAAGRFHAHRRPQVEEDAITTVEVSLAPSAAKPSTTHAEFSVDVDLPEVGRADAGRKVRYCDVCRRWGQRHSVHLCGSNWHEHLGDLLAVLAAGGAR
jgi:hypothetical protein